MVGPFPDHVGQAMAQSLPEVGVQGQKADGGFAVGRRRRWPWPEDGGIPFEGGPHQTSGYEALQ